MIVIFPTKKGKPCEIPHSPARHFVQAGIEVLHPATGTFDLAREKPSDAGAIIQEPHQGKGVYNIGQEETDRFVIISNRTTYLGPAYRPNSCGMAKCLIVKAQDNKNPHSRT